MLVLAPHVRIIADSDGAVVLDIKRNATFGLDPTTTYVWRGLEQSVSIEQIVKDLALETTESPAVVEEGVLDFLRDLKQKRMIVESNPAFNRTRSVRQALLLFALYDLVVPTVSVFSMRSLWVIHLAMTLCPKLEATTPRERVTEVCEAVEAACSWYPKQIMCLQRSAVTAILLRMEGANAQFVVAAQRFPFEAHAWVEVDGQVVNDRSEHISRFIVFERC